MLASARPHACNERHRVCTVLWILDLAFLPFDCTMRTIAGVHPDGGVDRAEIVSLELMPGVAVELMRTWFQRQVFPKHSHEYFTIALGLRGEGVVWFRGADHLRRRGEIVVIPPDVVHTGQPAPGSTLLSYLAAHVPPSVLALCAEAYDVRRDDIRALAPAIFRDASIRTALRRLDDAMSAAASGSAGGLADGAAADAVTCALGQLVRRHRPGPANDVGSGEPPRLVRVVRDIIEDCYADADRTSLAGISATCGVTPFHIVRLFTRSVGISPHRYLVQVRVRRACVLLARGVPPSFVAAMTGFADQSHLTLQFKRFVGTTPGSYQRCVYAGSRRLVSADSHLGVVAGTHGVARRPAPLAPPRAPQL
jgi:AraC-like DNA-binding protein/quercetin dioxygenase-like cupin family protein